MSSYERRDRHDNEPVISLDDGMLASPVAGITRDSTRAMGVIDCHGILACARGEVPPLMVNREVLHRPGFRAKLARLRSRAGGKVG